MNRNYLFVASVLLAATACSERGATPQPAPQRASAPATGVLEKPTALLGKWHGPEGTFLLLASKGGKYAVTIQNLDGPRTFPGQRAGDAIEFVRDGKTLSIRATDGAGTGMKWLSDKRDCVVVDAAEGYCRD